MLLASTFANSKVMNILVLTLVTFYATRLFIIQINPYFYTYNDWIPSSSEMSQVMSVLFFISSGLILGCYIGGKMGKGYRGNFHIIPFSKDVDEKKYYYLIILIFIVSKLILLYLLVTTGVGLPLDAHFFNPLLLRFAKIARSFGVFGLVPISWFILRKPQGAERKITIFAVALFVISTIISLSKVALIYAITPFLLVYYVTNIKIPPRLIKASVTIIIAVVIIMSSLVASLRYGLTNSFSGDGKLSYGGEAVSMISNNVLGFLGRVGSSFDVLSLTVTQRDQFLPFANIRNEFLSVVNGYWPGGFFSIDAPPWSQILYTIGHPGVSYESLLEIATGENITLPAHLYINFGTTGSCLVSFFLMLFYTLAYRYSKTVVVKIFLIYSLIFDISNGGGLVGMVIGYPMLYLWFFLVFIIYKFFFHTSRSQNPIVIEPTF